MIVQAKYTSGTGVLLGSGDHWLLVTDPGDEQVVQELWDALSLTAPTASSLAERALAILEKAFEGDPPALALVDFTSGASTSLSRGTGHVRMSGPARVLSLDGGNDPGSLDQTRRLVGGVVGADRVELVPLTTRTAPTAVAEQAPPPPATGTLIDGIPEEILAARGPDGPPPRTRTVMRAEDTGALPDTSEPDPLLMERIEEGTHTTSRGLPSDRRRCTWWMKCRSICSAASKSAMTPSFSGRIAVMASGVRPIMRLASCPTATTSPVSSRIATTEGSSSMMPLPRT